MSTNEVSLSQLADNQALATVVQPQEAATNDLSPNVTDAVETVKVKKVVRTGIKGRPLDNDGSTTMGRARLIFVENPTFTNIQLRDAIMDKTGCKKSVAATYASKVRSALAAQTVPATV